MRHFDDSALGVCPIEVPPEPVYRNILGGSETTADYHFRGRSGGGGGGGGGGGKTMSHDHLGGGGGGGGGGEGGSEMTV